METPALIPRPERTLTVERIRVEHAERLLPLLGHVVEGADPNVRSSRHRVQLDSDDAREPDVVGRGPTDPFEGGTGGDERMGPPFETANQPCQGLRSEEHLAEQVHFSAVARPEAENGTLDHLRTLRSKQLSVADDVTNGDLAVWKLGLGSLNLSPHVVLAGLPVLQDLHERLPVRLVLAPLPPRSPAAIDDGLRPSSRAPPDRPGLKLERRCRTLASPY